ncbi:MAG: BamA/TamA family outer membrane protein [Deltaproteobacteria bacterium]|nr:BamA/TamA family outer membrane protein [Deltaproteobacteria bacterium]
MNSISLMMTMLMIQVQPGIFASNSRPVVSGVILDIPAGIDVNTIKDLIDVKKNQPLSMKEVRRTLERLFQLGLFDQITATAKPGHKGLIITFHCRARRKIVAIDITGNKRFSSAKIGRLLHVRPGDDYLLDEVENRVDAVQYAYRRAGYHYAKVLFEPEKDRGGILLKIKVIEGKPLIISRILLTGHPAVKFKKILDLMDTRKGRILDLDRLDEDRKNIRKFYQDMGRFDAQVGDPGIEIHRDGKNIHALVRLRIESGPKIIFTFEGNQEVTSSRLRKLLKPRTEKMITKDVIDAMAGSLTEYYKRLGYFHAIVTGERINYTPDLSKVVFHIKEGPRVRIKRIDFIGNKAVNDSKLNKILRAVMEEENSRPILYQPVDPDLLARERLLGEAFDRSGGFRKPLSGKDVYVEDTFKNGLEEVVNYYRSLGYLSSSIGRYKLVFSKNGTNLTIKIPIHEGPRTIIAGLVIQGWPQPGSINELKKNLVLKPGGGLNPWKVDKSLKQILSQCRLMGYYYCDVKKTEKKQGDSTILIFKVEAGPLTKVGEIMVRGNYEIRSSLIKDRMTIRPGDLLTRDALKESRQRLIRTGLFTEVIIEPFEDKARQAIKKIVVEVREAPGSVFEVAGGISSEKGPSVRSSFERRNLAGRGIRAMTSARANYPMVYFLDPQFQEFLDQLPVKDRLERDINLSVSYPYLLVTRQFQLGIRGDISLLKRENHPAYGLDEQRFSISAFTDPMDRITGILEFEFTYDDVELAAGTRGGGDIPPEGISWSYGPRGHIVLDLRDDRFDPMLGFLASLSCEYKRSLPELNKDIDVNLLKGDIMLSGYFPIYRPGRLRMAVSIRIGAIKNFSRTNPTPVQERFFLGGRSDLRSLPEKTLYPADLSVEEIKSRNMERSEGGNSFFTFKVELRKSLFWGFELALFMDAGNLWLNPQPGDLIKVRYAAGLGLRYSTPVGPIAFDYGFNLDRRKELGEPVGAFHFSIGVF